MGDRPLHTEAELDEEDRLKAERQDFCRFKAEQEAARIMMFEQDRQRLKIRERILLEENSRLRKEEEKREVARIQALERDPLRVHDLVEESQHIVSDYDARSKAEEEEQLRTQAEQEVYGLYAEEEERLRVNVEEKSEQGAARLDSRLECLRIEAEKMFARFDAEEVERE